MTVYIYTILILRNHMSENRDSYILILAFFKAEIKDNDRLSHIRCIKAKYIKPPEYIRNFHYMTHTTRPISDFIFCKYNVK